MGDHARDECRWLSRIAVLQDCDRRDRSRAVGNGGARARRPRRVYRPRRAAVADRPACGWHVSRDAKGGSEYRRAAGAVGRRREHADTRLVPHGQRSATLAVQGAVMTRRFLLTALATAGALAAAEV